MKHFHDASLFFDDDGRVYVFSGTGALTELEPDLSGVKEGGVNMTLQVRDEEEKGLLEGSRVIKHDGKYYLLMISWPNGGKRRQLCYRADKITGPYEKKVILCDNFAGFPYVGQGTIVDDAKGNWYGVIFQDRGGVGRVLTLSPCHWIDGWPILGEVLDSNIGTMKWTGAMPFQADEKLSIQRSDDFDENRLLPQWQWNHQPRKGFFSLTERPGWLRLKAYRPLEPNQLLKAGNTLTQRTFRKQDNVVVVKMDNGQKAGLCHFSSPHSAIGVTKEGGICYLEFRENGKITKGMQVSSKHIWFSSQWGLDGKSRYAYSLDGDNFLPFGTPYQMAWGNYKGDRIGMYCFNDNSESGFVDVDYFHYR